MVPPIPTGPVADVYTCSNCKNTVSGTATRCPHCNQEFEWTENPDGSKTYTWRGMGSILKFVVIGAVLAFSAIAALVKKIVGSG